MYKIVYEKQAVRDIAYLKSAKIDKKAKALIDVIRDNPFQNPPPYEALIGNLLGLYSRRINIKHRLVYQVKSEECDIDNIHYDGIIKIIRMWSHYEGI